MNKIGIFQGRLSPSINGAIQDFPWDTWEDEFHKAKKVELDFIDWIVKSDNFYNNPLLTSEGNSSIKKIIKKTGIDIEIVCADCFMEKPFIRCSHSELDIRLDMLEDLINRISSLDIRYLEIPLEDNSAILNKKEFKEIIEIFRPIMGVVHQKNIKLSFETSLSPNSVRNFLAQINHSDARINYDMGNSASRGYNSSEELEIYGDSIATVHIKDRILNGGTIQLGEGNVDFSKCLNGLRNKKYAGPFVLQTARKGDEIELVRNNLRFIKKYLK